MGKNIVEKILAGHLVYGALAPGGEIGIRIDQTLTQDATGTLAYLQFEAMNVPRVRTELSVSYIDHNYTEQFSLDEIARRNNVSKYHFARRFKMATGFSFKEYLNHKRVEEAKALLRKNGVSIAEACYAVGFNDLSYFGRVFKRIEGRTPSAYRRQLRSQ